MVKIHHAHLYGTREEKYKFLSDNTVIATDFTEIKNQSPFYLLIPQDLELFSEYQKGFSIVDAMTINSVGIVTARDKFTIHWSLGDAWSLVKTFVSLSIEEARNIFKLGKDVQDWKVEWAQKDIKDNQLSKQYLKPVLYRPFDIRYTYYTGKSRGFLCRPRSEIMQHFLLGENIALITSRLTKGETYKHAQVTDKITEVICMSPKTSNNGFIFPLWLYPDPDQPQELQQKKRANFSPDFLKQIENNLGYLPEPKQIFYYIYGIFHSPTYRTRYAEFLKIDFPRVPLTSNKQLFQQLADYGEQLTQLHLMTSPLLEAGEPDLTYIDNGGEAIIEAGHPKYKNEQVIINKKGDGFSGVPKHIWEFYIGGYQVCHKWLKDRKGRTLSDEDITHYKKIIIALTETDKLMQKIDEAIPSFPIE